MYGIYLICDWCKTETIGGEQVTKNPEPPLSRFQGNELRARAKLRGWIHTTTANDVCPKCVQKKR